jgi:hypothetical protein
VRFDPSAKEEEDSFSYEDRNISSESEKSRRFDDEDDGGSNLSDSVEKIKKKKYGKKTGGANKKEGFPGSAEDEEYEWILLLSV